MEYTYMEPNYSDYDYVSEYNYDSDYDSDYNDYSYKYETSTKNVEIK